MNLTKNEISVLQELAKEYMQIASLPIQKEKINLWKSLNSGNMQRPMIVIDQLPWNELNYDGSLTCIIADPFWRDVENSLRTTIFKWKNFAVDMVVDPFIVIPQVIKSNYYGITISEETRQTEADNNILSHSYNNQIITEDDIDKIKDLEISYDKELTNELFEIAKTIFDGIAPVRLSGGMNLHLGLWDHLSFFMGVEDIYYNFVDQPEFVHKILNRITDATLSGIKKLNELNMHNNLANTCHCSYIYTDDLLPDSGLCKDFTTKNGWGFGMAQLMTCASPAMTEEFEIPYINKLSEHYGALYYGCCERLDDRLEIIKKIKNIRKISCSPWSNKRNFAENLGKNLVMSNKPSPSFLATTTFDADIIKKDLTETYNIVKETGINLEFILKDISTVKHDVGKLKEWAKIAMSVVES